MRQLVWDDYIIPRVVARDPLFVPTLPAAVPAPETSSTPPWTTSRSNRKTGSTVARTDSLPSPRSCRDGQDLQLTCSCSSWFPLASDVEWRVDFRYNQFISPARGCRRHIRLLARRSTAREPLQGLLQGRSQIWTNHQGGLAPVLGLCASARLNIWHSRRPPAKPGQAKYHQHCRYAERPRKTGPRRCR